MEKIRFPVTKPALNWAEIGLKPIYEDQQHKSRKRSVVGFVCAVPHSPLFRVATESSMGRIGSPLGKNEFSWVIKDFSSLGVRAIYSDEFVIGGCKWRLIAYPMGNRIKKYMSLYVEVADSKHLPSGWSINTELRMEVVNHNLYKPSQQKYRKNLWFDQKTPSWGYKTMIRHSKLSGEEGFLGSRPLKKIKRNDDGVKSNDSVNKTQQVKETMDVNGFQVLPSQVTLVSRILKKYPDIALGFNAKNRHLRTACMNVLISLIETLCQSPQELSDEDMDEADNALVYVQDAGFKVDWLDKKLKEVKEKKVVEQTGKTRIQELEEELKEFKQKCLDREALLEKEKAKVLAARASLTLDDFV
ncbi:unnamed protein product [Arabidopsis thaliana]|uniref:(thale cress) hypothetical protein n=1 Tax=Arabidopsis thaliana TaxID=3702 RepID=A0A7G2ETN2_ARATH|nr:unnamed protein product [Arabidopsis thaliana]